MCPENRNEITLKLIESKPFLVYQADLKDITKYEPKLAPVLSKGETVSQSKFIDPDDANSVDVDVKALRERFDKFKNEETDRKQK